MAEDRRDNKHVSLYYITESSLRQKFHLLFDYKCDIIARVIYIKMSKRTDKAKIDFIKFINCFMGLLDEVKDRRNRAAFDLLEFNGDA